MGPLDASPTPSPAAAAASLDALQDRVGPVIAQTVDALQVAALLEADGITDAIAREVYGVSDVFRLATRVRRRCLPGPDARPGAGPDGRRTIVRGDDQGPRLLAHGPLYLLPVVLFPPVLALLGSRPLVLGLVVGAGLAWVWAGTATWLAYRLLGQRQDTSARHVLQLFALAGLPLAAVVGYLVAGATGGGLGLTAVACGQMAYQMGATLLMFHHREKLLLVAMLPAAVVGVTYLVLTPSPQLAVLAVLAGTGCVGTVLGLSLAGPGAARPRTAARTLARATRAAWGPVREAPGQVALVTLHTGLSAAYLLHAQARYMQGSLAVSVGLLPLIAAMGLVELLAFRFRRRAHALLSTVRYPTEFATRVVRIVVVDLVSCVALVLVLGAGVVGLLAAWHVLTPATVAMAVAGGFLAAAYYAGFLLTGLGMVGPLCAAVALALVVHVGALALVPAARSALADTSVFALTAALLLALSVSRLVPAVADPRTHA